MLATPTNRKLLEGVAGDVSSTRPMTLTGSEQIFTSVNISIIWCEFLINELNFQVVDKLVERDREIQQLVEKGV